MCGRNLIMKYYLKNFALIKESGRLSLKTEEEQEKQAFKQFLKTQKSALHFMSRHSNCGLLTLNVCVLTHIVTVPSEGQNERCVIHSAADGAPWNRSWSGSK